MSKMDDMRAQLDAQSGFVPKKYEPNDEEINSVIRDQVSELYTKKAGTDANMRLAKKILDLNPDLPRAFEAKFEVMALNSHFATNVHLVVEDCYRNKIKLKMSDGGKSPKKIEKIGD